MVKRRIRKFSLGIIIAACAIFYVLAVVSLGIAYSLRLANKWQSSSDLAVFPQINKSQRIMVIAPHCDDETLGCAGLLTLAAKAGAKTRVVLVTNGDGFKFAAAKIYRTVNVTHKKLIDLAYARQKETQNALSALKIPKSNVVFLGYPDRGIASLWDEYWLAQNPYQSKNTGWKTNNYFNAPSKGKPYCGENLLIDIEKQIKLFKPTDIFIPHPSDNHPDHFVTYCFASSAIEQAQSEGIIKPNSIKTHTYIVHRGDWPCADKDPMLAPPHALINEGTKWSSLYLPEWAQLLKRKAIKDYKSQSLVDRGFLKCFIRSNEIFGLIKERDVREVSNNTIKMDANISEWIGVTPAILDPVGDKVVADLESGGDVRSVFVCKDSKNYYLRIDFVGKLSKQIRYVVEIKEIHKDDTSSYFKFWMKPKRNSFPENLNWAYRQNTLEIALPKIKYNLGSHIYLRVSTKLSRINVDNSGWQDLRNN